MNKQTRDIIQATFAAFIMLVIMKLISYYLLKYEMSFLETALTAAYFFNGHRLYLAEKKIKPVEAKLKIAVEALENIAHARMAWQLSQETAKESLQKTKGKV